MTSTLIQRILKGKKRMGFLSKLIYSFRPIKTNIGHDVTLHNNILSIFIVLVCATFYHRFFFRDRESSMVLNYYFNRAILLVYHSLHLNIYQPKMDRIYLDWIHSTVRSNLILGCYIFSRM